MPARLLTLLLPAALPLAPDPRVQTQVADSALLIRLEEEWNRAHVAADTAALIHLWDDDLLVAVPEMPAMSKADLLGFWRSGRSAITRYETSAVRVRVYADAAVVTGRLFRERNFNGRIVADHWQFTKVYVRTGGRWRVVSFHASQAPR